MLFAEKSTVPFLADPQIPGSKDFNPSSDMELLLRLIVSILSQIGNTESLTGSPPDPIKDTKLLLERFIEVTEDNPETLNEVKPLFDKSRVLTFDKYEGLSLLKLVKLLQFFIVKDFNSAGILEASNSAGAPNIA